MFHSSKFRHSDRNITPGIVVTLWRSAQVFKQDGMVLASGKEVRDMQVHVCGAGVALHAKHSKVGHFAHKALNNKKPCIQSTR